jgi:hypothetical protein
MARLSRFDWEAHWHFDSVADYIWKTPEFLELQERIELEKLAEFGDYPAARDLRWQIESHRLYVVFPTLMATSNLFTVMSLLEFYLLRLVVICGESTGVVLDTVPGQGVQRLLNYLRRLQIDPTQVTYWPQIDAGLKLRHCLMHANGLLLHSRQQRELRRIVQSRTYLAAAHRRSVPEDNTHVTIVSSSLGERLKVHNQYPWILSSYVRDYVSVLGQNVGQMLE